MYSTASTLCTVLCDSGNRGLGSSIDTSLVRVFSFLRRRKAAYFGGLYLGTEKTLRRRKDIRFSLFLDGMTYRKIATALDREGIRIPTEKNKWMYTTVKSIPSNEKYKGDVFLRKNVTVDFLTR